MTNNTEMSKNMATTPRCCPTCHHNNGTVGQCDNPRQCRVDETFGTWDHSEWEPKEEAVGCASSQT